MDDLLLYKFLQNEASEDEIKTVLTASTPIRPTGNISTGWTICSMRPRKHP